MKNISTVNLDLINEYWYKHLDSLPQVIFEKDIHVTHAIQAIASMPEHDVFDVVFCGGTCLSKAYNLLDRMSEDVDFKIVLKDPSKPLTTSSLKTKLSVFGKSVVAALERAGFDGDGAITRRARDNNFYTRISASYESNFSKVASIRPDLLVELNFTEILLPTEVVNVQNLISTLSGIQTQESFTVPCISLTEAMAEKLISFPRRLGRYMAKNNFPKEGMEKFSDASFAVSDAWDSALVRHIYDVSVVGAQHPDVFRSEIFGEVLAKVVTKDSFDFKKDHIDFLRSPQEELRNAMLFAKDSQSIAAQYNAFLSDMVYKKNPPTFLIAVEDFSKRISDGLNSQSFTNSMKKLTHLKLSQNNKDFVQS